MAEVTITEEGVSPETLRVTSGEKVRFKNGSRAQLLMKFGGAFFDELLPPDYVERQWRHVTLDPGADLVLTANEKTAEEHGGVKTKAHRYVIDFIGRNKSFPKQGLPGPHDKRLEDDPALDLEFRPIGDDPHLIIE